MKQHPSVVLTNTAHVVTRVELRILCESLSQNYIIYSNRTALCCRTPVTVFHGFVAMDVTAR